MLKLETPRLILRSFKMDDLEPFVAYRSDPDNARYQGWDAPFPVDVAKEFLTEMTTADPGAPGTWYQIAIERKSDGRLLGDCGVGFKHDDLRQAEIGFTLARAAHGQGYATEAVLRLLGFLLDDLDFHRVVAICDVENIPSARLLERVGMRREGHFIENVWFKGRWSSEYQYAILQREWQAQHPQFR